MLPPTSAREMDSWSFSRAAASSLRICASIASTSSTSASFSLASVSSFSIVESCLVPGFLTLSLAAPLLLLTLLLLIFLRLQGVAQCLDFAQAGLQRRAQV